MVKKAENITFFRLSLGDVGLRRLGGLSPRDVDWVYSTKHSLAWKTRAARKAGPSRPSTQTLLVGKEIVSNFTAFIG